MKKKHTSVCIAGAAPDTGNHGVTALCYSTIAGLADRGISEFTLFDHGTGLRQAPNFHWAKAKKIQHLGFKGGKRIYSSDHMLNMTWRQKLGLPSESLKVIQHADAILDVSGGDSFTDLYGPARFRQITTTKLLAIASGVPLILMPQTYGPYKSDKAQNIARFILQKAHIAWARDPDSFARMQNLLGASFDPNQHKLGVDLAFGLPARSTGRPALQNTIGINVSGLIWNQQQAAKEQFNLKADYKTVLKQLSVWLLENDAKHILYIPHVTPVNNTESDLQAAKELKAALPERFHSRIQIETSIQDPIGLKGLIRETDWFLGARMHATIAALSSAKPVANLAYSLKAKGVFATCSADDQVFDMRHQTTDELLAALKQAYQNRAHTKNLLECALPYTKRRWAMQMDAIANQILASEHEEKKYG